VNSRKRKRDLDYDRFYPFPVYDRDLYDPYHEQSDDALEEGEIFFDRGSTMPSSAAETAESKMSPERNPERQA